MSFVQDCLNFQKKNEKGFIGVTRNLKKNCFVPLFTLLPIMDPISYGMVWYVAFATHGMACYINVFILLNNTAQSPPSGIGIREKLI